MKNKVLILLIIGGLTSCIPDFSKECLSYLRFYIVHNFSTEEFDEKIGNDVHLRIYKDSTLIYGTLIPYSAIQGGNPYEMVNRYTGKLDVVLWAVPYDDEVPGKIPEGNTGEHKTAKNISMIQIPGREHHYPLGDLYFGEHHIESKANRGQTDTYYIPMRNTACRVTLKIMDETGSSPYQQSYSWMELEGIMSELDFELTPRGKEAKVMSGLYYDTEEELITSGAVGVLPSAETQTLKLTVYEDETALFRIDTKEKAVLGGEVYIIITGDQQQAGIFVDGWRVRTVDIDYM